MKILSCLMSLAVAGPAFACELMLPETLADKAVVLNADDPEHARAVAGSAINPPGKGGVSTALVVRITRDIPVYRLWNGPGKKDSRGNTNRLGAWWSYDRPAGPADKYRFDYEICRSWNELSWVATCTLKKGAVVAIGPGQSVSTATCGNADGWEEYQANARGWQTYVDKPWTRGAELECPPESQDYPLDPTDIARPR